MADFFVLLNVRSPCMRLATFLLYTLSGSHASKPATVHDRMKVYSNKTFSVYENHLFEMSILQDVGSIYIGDRWCRKTTESMRCNGIGICSHIGPIEPIAYLKIR